MTTTPASASGDIALSVVIPMYNESKRIVATLDDACTWLAAEQRPSELILIDDGSTDDTAAVVGRWLTDEARGGLSRVSLVRLGANRGKGAAVRTGLGAATGRWRLMMDADNSARVQEVHKLAARADSTNATLVAGSRAAADSRVQARSSRRLMGRLFHLSLRALGLAPIRDTQCGFKLYRADLANLIARIARENGFAFDVEHLLIACRYGRVEEVGIAWEHRGGGSIRPFRDGMKMLARSAVIRLRTPRVKAAVEIEPKPRGADVVVRWDGNEPRAVAGVRGADQ